MVFCVTEPDFLRKNALKMGKMGEKSTKNRVINFFLNLAYKKNLYYLLYSCINPILEKNSGS